MVTILKTVSKYKLNYTEKSDIFILYLDFNDIKIKI